MDNPIFKDNQRAKHLNETMPFNSINALMKKVSQQLSKGKSKTYKFTGNRAMAKRARGNHFLSGFVGKLKSQVKLSGIYYGLVEVKDHRVAIIAFANKQFLRFIRKRSFSGI